MQNLPELEEWLPKEVSSLFDNVSWKECIIKIHKEEIKINAAKVAELEKQKMIDIDFLQCLLLLYRLYHQQSQLNQVS